MSKKKKKTTVHPMPNLPAGAPAQIAMPQDHQQPSSGPQNMRIEVRNISLVIDGSAMDDVELFDMIERFGAAGTEAEGLRLVPKLLRGLVGDEQFPQIMDLIRSPETGRVTFDAANQLIVEIMQELNPNS